MADSLTTIDTKPSSDLSLAAGVVIAERYVLDRRLGAGGMGEVWSATHLLTKKPVALKFLRGPANLDRTRRLIREAQAAGAVRHPNVVEIHDVLTLDYGLPALVMDLLEGESLAQRLARSDRLSLHDLAAIMVPVMSAVGAAHAAGIVHRDLKPDNIFLAQLGDGRVEPKVLDFGICKLRDSEGPAVGHAGQRQFLLQASSSETITGAVMGTPHYMAPEQVFGERDVDARADVWALGVILYECSTGKKPVDGENVGQMIKLITAGAITPIEQLAPDLPPQYVKLVNRMLTQDRERRPSDLREAFVTLRDLMGLDVRSFDGAVYAPPSPSSGAAPSGGQFNGPPAVGRARFIRTSAAIFAILALVALGFLGPLLYRRTQVVQPAAGVVQPPRPLQPTTSREPPMEEAAPLASGTAPEGQPMKTSPYPSRDRRVVRKAPAKTKHRGRPLAGGIHGSVPF